MNALASRKKLLVAESELNRAQLVQEWQAIADIAHALKDRAKTIGTLASAAILVTGLTGFGHRKTAPAAEKSSWLQTVLKGAGLVFTLWQAFRSQRHEQKEK